MLRRHKILQIVLFQITENPQYQIQNFKLRNFQSCVSKSSEFVAGNLWQPSSSNSANDWLIHKLKNTYSTAQQKLSDQELTISQKAIEQLQQIRKEQKDTNLMLRVSVQAGGCSGFQYQFNLDQLDNVQDTDRVFEEGGIAVAVDDVSLPFLKGATIDFEDSLIRQAFKVEDNPGADSSCGCKASFAPKF